jgi:hypothetical protein
VTGSFSSQEFNFDIKVYFLYFLIIFCESRERLTGFQHRERKSLLTPIPTTKIVEIDVNKFHLVIVVVLSLNIDEKIYSV